MGLTNENVGPKILAKIKIYVLTRAELLFTLCYEIPCTSGQLKCNLSATWVHLEDSLLHILCVLRCAYLRKHT